MIFQCMQTCYDSSYGVSYEFGVLVKSAAEAKRLAEVDHLKRFNPLDEEARAFIAALNAPAEDAAPKKRGKKTKEVAAAGVENTDEAEG